MLKIEFDLEDRDCIRLMDLHSYLQAAGQVLLFGKALDPDAIAHEIDAVTPAQLAALTTRILEHRKAAVAILGPKAAHGAAERFERALFG